jgi:hypothetical protein
MFAGGCAGHRPRILFVEFKFTKHYTRDEAQALIPQLREWLANLNRLRASVERFEKRLSGLMAESQDTGGELVNNWVRALVEMQATLVEFQRREIYIKDLARGLIDFPAVVGGREVFLCWESDEDAIEFWHDLDSGYGGREKLH